MSPSRESLLHGDFEGAKFVTAGVCPHSSPPGDMTLLPAQRYFTRRAFLR